MRFTITPLGGPVVPWAGSSTPSSAASRPLDGEALPAALRPIDHAVTRRLARSTGELTAWELDQATKVHALPHDIEAIGF